MLPEVKGMADRIFVILDHFLISDPPPVDPENQNFEKMKKMTGDIIVLHMCTKNDDHMIYGF